MDDVAPWYDATALALYRALGRPFNWLRSCFPSSSMKSADAAISHADLWARRSDEELQEGVRDLRGRLRRDGFSEDLVAQCFALIAEAAFRTMGQRHYPCQFTAGWLLLQSRLVEMATGEGKSIAATLPAVVAAWAGLPVHVITVNDYLARRDAEAFRPLCEFLGLSIGVVVHELARDRRRVEYAKSIVYVSNKELAFDYLRDRITAGEMGSRLHMMLEALQGSARPRDSLPVLRGLVFGIVDEADSVFIDEARTPLILANSEDSSESLSDYRCALEIARSLEPGIDFRLDVQHRGVVLLERAHARISSTATWDGVWSSARAAAEMVAQALRALHLHHVDRDYVVADGKVQIVDESTGRVMPDRKWEHGLHQMIEVKEGCELSNRQETVARITYQRLFRRYIRLAGMTGTAAEVADELHAVYALKVSRIPLHRPSRRSRWADCICASSDEKWSIVAHCVEQLAVRDGRPVLVGTRSVHASEQISELLRSRGVAHALLNAKQDQQEAEIIAMAGQPGRITVATNMAGRGTDIKLGCGVAALGGLHVILTEYHESPRVDRQLFGRCARQGDPGSCQAIVSIDDELYVANAPQATRLARALILRYPGVRRIVMRTLTKFAQANAERRNALARVQTLSADRRLEKTLAFSGTAK